MDLDANMDKQTNLYTLQLIKFNNTSMCEICANQASNFPFQAEVSLTIHRNNPCTCLDGKFSGHGYFHIWINVHFSKQGNHTQRIQIWNSNLFIKTSSFGVWINYIYMYYWNFIFGSTRCALQHDRAPSCSIRQELLDRHQMHQVREKTHRWVFRVLNKIMHTTTCSYHHQ